MTAAEPNELGKTRTEAKGADLSFLTRPRSPHPPPDPDPVSDGQEQRETQEPAQQPPARPPAQAEATTKPVIAYIPAKLRDQLKRVCGTTRRSYTEVLFDAVDDLDDHLGEVFAEHQPDRLQQSLFTRRRRLRPAAPGKTTVPLVQVPMRMLAADLALIDERAARFAAGNRSEFIRVVLRAYLR